MNNFSFLLVDDNAIALREITNTIKYLGYQKPRSVESAVEAWAILKVTLFDCIVSAWDMPEMSGLAFLKIVRRDDIYAELPFFLTDSNVTQPKVLQAGQAGVTGLIVKPFTVEVVKDKLEVLAENLGKTGPSETEITLDDGM